MHCITLLATFNHSKNRHGMYSGTVILATFDHSRKQTRSDVFVPCVEQEYDHLNDSGDEEQ